MIAKLSLGNFKKNINKTFMETKRRIRFNEKDTEERIKNGTPISREAFLKRVQKSLEDKKLKASPPQDMTAST